MKFKIFHQVGHIFKWNLGSLTEDNCGDGLIVAPRYMQKDKVENLDPEIRHASMFDPQFFY